MLTIHMDKPFDFKCLDCGLFSVDGEWIYPSRTGSCYELIYAVSGNIYVMENDKEYVLKKGDVLILRPGTKWEGTQGSFGRTSFYWAQFEVSKAEFVPDDNLGFFGDDKDLSPYFEKLLQAAHTPGEPEFIADAQLLVILNEIRLNKVNGEQKPPRFLRDLAEWIRVNSDKKLTVEIVSKLFGYNSDYLSGVFNDYYGMGLKEYINEQKIMLVKDLLLNTNYPVKQIADILGYSNENQFINYFKYHTGLSPTKFKAQYFNGNKG